MSITTFHEGDKSRAICSHCAKMVSTTFVRRDVQFSDGNGFASNVLVAVCDKCGDVVATPAQSTPAFRAARS
ncbi:hypothetical protein [Cupriavidus sp. YR651]|uniref:hypothetical protein n=1 Tax=Cupriavidus sp. YR651 TaxID=1855315 RepID=UPI00115FCB03|nr:hypothetical protein [Cupriavidus sp. YR651]